MKLCPECHHYPSGRIAEYSATCDCSCHDVADAAPELLSACQNVADWLNQHADAAEKFAESTPWESLAANSRREALAFRRLAGELQKAIDLATKKGGTK